MASSAYSPATVKRQKVKEASRSAESNDYFQGIEKVEYNNNSPTSDTLAYRYYNHSERLHGRCMEDWLKLSVSFTVFKYNGSDKYGKPTYQRPWNDGSNAIDNHKREIKACFDFCQKLGVKYWTAFDADLVPSCESHEEWKNNVDEIVEFVQECAQRTHVKPLWIAPNLHSNSRYACGACTSHDANIFSRAASQTKRALEMAQRLNAEHFLLWPHREGYDTLYRTDLPKEIKLFAKLLKMIAEYKERIGFRGQLLILPCYADYRHGIREGGDERIDRYMWDVTSCLYLLKHFNLDRFYKVCAQPGHEMYMAQVYNMLGGITVSNFGNSHDNNMLTLMMKSIVEQGNTVLSGINLSLHSRRDSVDFRDLFLVYVKHIDMLANSLRIAAIMISEQLFSKHVQERYLTYYSGLGARLLTGNVTLEECDEYTKKNQHNELHSTRAEHWDIVFQRYLDRCDHI